MNLRAAALALAAAAMPALPRSAEAGKDAWLAYRDSDCELAGVLTGAGGAWPSVHGLSCRIEHARQRIAALDAATECLHDLAPDARRHGQPGCLGGLVDWEMQGN